jgi:hypothetical protein
MSKVRLQSILNHLEPARRVEVAAIKPFLLDGESLTPEQLHELGLDPSIPIELTGEAWNRVSDSFLLCSSFFFFFFRIFFFFVLSCLIPFAAPSSHLQALGESWLSCSIPDTRVLLFWSLFFFSFCSFPPI